MTLCPCCDAELADIDGAMVRSFVSGYAVGKSHISPLEVLCERHRSLAVLMVADLKLLKSGDSS